MLLNAKLTTHTTKCHDVNKLHAHISGQRAKVHITQDNVCIKQLENFSSNAKYSPWENMFKLQKVVQCKEDMTV